MALYLDSSALVKLVIEEAQTEIVRAWIGTVDDELLSSHLAQTEVIRAVRLQAPDLEWSAVKVLSHIQLMTLPSAIFDEASKLRPATLRTLDALHLACALSLGRMLAGIVTYDRRLTDAAHFHGIRVIVPS